MEVKMPGQIKMEQMLRKSKLEYYNFFFVTHKVFSLSCD